MHPGARSGKTCAGSAGILVVCVPPDFHIPRPFGSMSQLPPHVWFNEPSPTPCPWCHTHHNQSVHGMLTCPSPSQPFVQAWLQSWGPNQGISQAWRAQASPRERFLLGKLVIPTSLHETLRDSLGARPAKSSIRHFQRSILRLLPPLIPSYTPAQKATFNKRPNPWSMNDWLPPPL